MNKGFVYILTNEFMPGLIKIGRTESNPKARASQLFTTGVPGGFKIAEAVKTNDCKGLEAQMHDWFAPVRVNSRREFFRHDAREAALILRVAAFSWGAPK